jgi:hypothetical protein
MMKLAVDARMKYSSSFSLRDTRYALQLKGDELNAKLSFALVVNSMSLGGFVFLISLVALLEIE